MTYPYSLALRWLKTKSELSRRRDSKNKATIKLIGEILP